MANARNGLRPITPRDVQNLETVAARLIGTNGEETEVPTAIYHLIQDILPALRDGQTMLLVPTHKSLTTQQAADILGTSRTYFKKLLDRGEIPYQKVGTHRRVKFTDVMAYQERRDAERQRQMDDLLATSVEMGAYKKTITRDLCDAE